MQGIDCSSSEPFDNKHVNYLRLSKIFSKGLFFLVLIQSLVPECLHLTFNGTLVCVCDSTPPPPNTWLSHFLHSSSFSNTFCWHWTYFWWLFWHQTYFYTLWSEYILETAWSPRSLSLVKLWLSWVTDLSFPCLSVNSGQKWLIVISATFLMEQHYQGSVFMR